MVPDVLVGDPPTGPGACNPVELDTQLTCEAASHRRGPNLVSVNADGRYVGRPGRLARRLPGRYGHC